ncbi:hypothetical protein J4218_06425 [Candidatus Pacearchaeota archaeon]|nr:hypothetical protein [Candidatus Pacearchaeota archaeon]
MSKVKPYTYVPQESQGYVSFRLELENQIARTLFNQHLSESETEQLSKGLERLAPGKRSRDIFRFLRNPNDYYAGPTRLLDSYNIFNSRTIILPASFERFKANDSSPLVYVSHGYSLDAPRKDLLVNLFELWLSSCHRS